MKSLPVVKSTLKPLYAAGHQSILVHNHEMARKTTDTLRAHGVAFIRHGRASYLSGLKRFFYFLRNRLTKTFNQEGRRHNLQIGKEPQICSNLVCCGTKRSQGGKNINVDFTWVGLWSDRIGIIETRKVSNKLVQLFDLKQDLGRLFYPFFWGYSPSGGHHQTKSKN